MSKNRNFNAEAELANLKMENEKLLAENLNLKEKLTDIHCYSVNATEFMLEFKDKFVTDDGKLVKITFANGVAIVNTVWEKVKETVRECQGREIQVQLPGGISGLVVNSLLLIIKTITGVTIKL